MKPLAGVRVIDLTTVIAGPAATSVLGQFGADVIKIERAGGEESRLWGKRIDDVSLTFDTFNRGKRSIVIDLGKDEGKALLHRLLATADVFIHNVRPSAARRLEIDKDALKELFPTLIYCAISGYGEGPEGRSRAGVDPAIQAFSGMMEMTGHDGTPPTRCPISLIDMETGRWAAISIMAALMRGPVKEFVDIELALVDSAIALMPHQASEALLTGERPPRYGSGNPLATPHEVMTAQDRPIFVGAPTQAKWLELTEAIGAQHLQEDPSFATLAARLANRPALLRELNAIFGQHPAAVWLDKLRHSSIVVSEVLSLDEAVRHPVAEERRWFDTNGRFPAVRFPVLINGEALAPPAPAPRAGEHTAEILDELGLDTIEIDRLVDGAAVVAAGPTA